MMKKFLLFVFGLIFFFSSQATAQNKVVVIPLLGGEATVPAPVEKTGQDSGIVTGDDGDLEKGVVWPSPRFTDNSNGTVTDNLTGLIWVKNASCFGLKFWYDALSDCNGLAAGYCGLTDGSSAGDWRLPNLKELQSLLDLGNFGFALPTGHPFSSVQPNRYWSSTTLAGHAISAWSVVLVYGHLNDEVKATTYAYVWPVRGGN